MKLTAKIVATLVVGIGLVLVVFTRSQIEQATSRSASDMREDARTVGRLFRPVIARAWRMEGKAAAMYLIQYTNETLRSEQVTTKMRVRWVWLDEAEAAAEPEAAPTLARAQLQPLWNGQEVSARAHAPDGEERLYTYVPVLTGIDGEPPGALEISESTEPLLAYASDVRSHYIHTGLVLVAICSGIVLVIGTWFVGRPLRILASAADRLGAGDLSVRVHLRQRDEVGALARTLSSSAARLEQAREELAAETESRIRAVEQLRHADRLSSVGTLTSGLAHELGTPLAVIAGRSKLIADGTVTGDKVVEYARSIAGQADRMADIIRQLLEFARRRRVHLAGKDLASVVRPTLELLRPMARKRSVELVLDESERPVHVAADLAQLQQVFANLIMNAIDATSRPGPVTISVRVCRATPPADRNLSPGAFACCSVRDRGDGILPDHVDKLFEPFFTTKPVGKGTGLGLAVSYGIVAEHGGWIEVDSSPGEGAEFSVYLPLERANASEDPAGG